VNELRQGWLEFVAFNLIPCGETGSQIGGQRLLERAAGHAQGLENMLLDIVVI
jgi:hypothetical protein